MINKKGNILSLMLYAFVISYLLSSAFNKYGLETNTIISSILIIVSTVIVVGLITKIFLSKQESETN